MKRIRIDLSGKRFSRLYVRRFHGVRKGFALWECGCDCGGTTVVSGAELRRGHTRSCGCLQRHRARECNVVHGGKVSGRQSSEYTAWINLRSRCYSPQNADFADYGGRGIVVCPRWLTSYAAFLADMGRKPTATHSIDRKDVNGNYEPSNCRWATPHEQRTNQRRMAG